MNPAWDNLDDFLQLDDFAVPAVVQFQAGGQRDIRGVFDDPSLTAKLGGYDRDDNQVTLTVKGSDAAGIRRGDTVSVAGTTYDVLTTPRADGTGMAAIVLAGQ
jgi:hypothetical protein